MTGEGSRGGNGALGNVTVLVVDDEELMREVVSIMLEENGAHVLTAVDGEDAVRVFKENVGRVNVVFMDFSMPRMNGYEAWQEMRKVQSDIAIIMVSGLNMTPEVEELQKRGEVAFLSKPFHEQDLIGRISALVER